MKYRNSLARFDRITAVLLCVLLSAHAYAQTDSLCSWNDGPAKQAIISFVKETTDGPSPKFVPPEARIAIFDQDGTTWVEQPNYAEMMFAFDRLGPLIAKHPELKLVEPL